MNLKKYCLHRIDSSWYQNLKFLLVISQKRSTTNERIQLIFIREIIYSFIYLLKVQIIFLEIVEIQISRCNFMICVYSKIYAKISTALFQNC